MLHVGNSERPLTRVQVFVLFGHGVCGMYSDIGQADSGSSGLEGQPHRIM